MDNLVTPFDIARTPFKAEGFAGKYDHDLQLSFGTTQSMSNYQTNTFGGTQTFGGNGRPSDSDNDTDRGQ